MKTEIPCLYAIVRFRPFVETGEFANVGIVLAAPKEGLLLFKLMDKRFSRVSNFFEQLPIDVLRNCLVDLRIELELLQTMVQQAKYNQEHVDLSRNLFHELVRERETMIRYSEVGTILSQNPELTVEKLYARYVERDFTEKKNHDLQLEQHLHD